mgnify:CR=1 FL=1
MTRKIPIISLEDFEAKAKKPIIMKSIVENITEGIEGNLESVNIAEIKNQDVTLSVPKGEWKSGLEKAMEYYVEIEEYGECLKIKKLIKNLDIYNFEEEIITSSPGENKTGFIRYEINKK